jgi:DNA-binding beta-propeller fold protein YncE
MNCRILTFAATALLVAGACATRAAPAPAPGVAAGEYVVFVASESADEVAELRFGADGLRVAHTRAVGMNPVDIDAPHGLAVAPDGRYYYVTLGHGTPFGHLWKLSAETNRFVGQVTLGLYPATVDVTPDGMWGLVVNFNLHGDHVPSSVSKVYLPDMVEVARIETCVMPHGSRINPQGTRHYSACMMDDLLVELDIAGAEVHRLFSVRPGAERPVDPQQHRHGQHGAGHAQHGRHPAQPGAPPRALEAHGGVTTESTSVCSPTWAHPSADGARVYVACNRSNEVIEIDVESWTLLRRIETGPNPYNLDVTPDGRLLLVTLKDRTEPSTEVYEIATGRRLARVRNTTVLPHGLAVSSDSRYAFVSVEGVGAEPGKVDVIDLRTFRLVASAEVGQQAGGIDVVR